MRFKLKKTFLIALLTIFAGVVYGARDNGGQDGTEGNVDDKTTTQNSTASPLSKGAPQTKSGASPGMDSNDGIFYSNAKMYVAPHADANLANEPSMFIMGTAEFGNSAQIDQQGITALTGHFLSSKNADPDAVTLYGSVLPMFLNPNTSGTVRFLGEWNKQEIKRIPFKKADGTVDYSSVLSDLKLESPDYLLNFPVIQVKKEGISKMADIPPVATDGTVYDPFEVGYVSVATNVAIRVQELDITEGNRFSADVKSSGVEKINSGGSSATGSEWYKLNSAYADIRALTEGPAGTYPGHSEVNLDLYFYDNTKNGATLTGGHFGGTLDDTSTQFIASNSYEVGTNRYATFMRSMTSPFEKLRADYMFYHVLTTPEHGSITGVNGPVADPRTELTPGRGYFYAMDVSADYFQQINDNWSHGGTGWLNRARGGYRFSRLLQEHRSIVGGATNHSLYTIASGQSNYEAQRFNVGNVEVDLAVVFPKEPRLNILGNPYMTPIFIGDVLAEKDNTGSYITSPSASQVTTPFVTGYVGNVDPDNPTVKAVHQLTDGAFTAAESGGYALIRPTYWVVNTGFVMTSSRNGIPTYAYNIKYDVVDFWRTGSVPDQEKKILEPMQMFVLHVASPGKFVFNTKMKELPDDPLRFDVSIMNDFSNMPDTRTKSLTKGSVTTPIQDWLIIETAVTGELITTDRAAVRFYNDGTLGFNDQHDIEKQLTPTINSDTKGATDDELDIFEPMNVVYTKASDGRPLLGNGIGYSTKEVPLYYVPSNKLEEVTLTVWGIETLKDVEGAWLVEKDANGNEVYKQDLLQDNAYRFVSTPVENSLEADNRFILRFFDDGNDTPDITEKPITCYYSGSTLYIGGLNENDLGSKVQIFDLQGRLMGNTVVNNHPSMEYQKPLGQGTFIVRITGKRNYTTKFVNIQNY